MSEPHSRPRSSRFGLLLVGILGLGGVGFAARPLVFGPEVRIVRPESGDVVRNVVATGRILAPNRVEIGTQVTGVVEAVLADEGETVKRDQMLIRLENAEARAAAAAAEAALAQASTRVIQIAEVALPTARAGLAQVDAAVAAAEAAFDRAVKLKSTGFATQSQIDDARKTRDVALAQQRAARFQVTTNDTGGTDRVMAEAALRQAAANLAAARTRLAYTTIESPADGLLLARNVERGDVVQPGKSLLTLSPTGETQIVVQIDEKNLSLLAPGEKAWVSADAYPRERFAAELFHVDPAIDPQTASVQVKLRVPDPPAWIRQDMTVSVDIEVARRTAALVLPIAAVHDPLSDRSWILVATDGRAQRRPVRLGLAGGGRVIVEDGVAANDLVVPVRASVEPGDRLRPIEAANGSAAR